MKSFRCNILFLWDFNGEHTKDRACKNLPLEDSSHSAQMNIENMIYCFQQPTYLVGKELKLFNELVLIITKFLFAVINYYLGNSQASFNEFYIIL